MLYRHLAPVLKMMCTSITCESRDTPQPIRIRDAESALSQDGFRTARQSTTKSNCECLPAQIGSGLVSLEAEN